jgi:hypothetical protein
VSRGGDCANEAIQLWGTRDGGASWARAGAGGAPASLVAVSPYTYEHARDAFNESELGFGDPTSIVLDARDAAASFYYVLISAANPPIGDNGYSGLQQRGQCLLRARAPLAWPLAPSAWRAWDGAGFGGDLTADPYAAPVANLSAHVCKPVNCAFSLRARPAPAAATPLTTLTLPRRARARPFPKSLHDPC